MVAAAHPWFLLPPYVAEVVSGVGPLAQLVAQPLQVSAVQLDHLAALEAELVHRGGEGVVVTSGVSDASFREARQFLARGWCSSEGTRRTVGRV